MLSFNTATFVQDLKAASTFDRRFAILSPRAKDITKAPWGDVKDTGIIEALLEMGTAKRFDRDNFGAVRRFLFFEVALLNECFLVLAEGTGYGQLYHRDYQVARPGHRSRTEAPAVAGSQSDQPH